MDLTALNLVHTLSKNVEMLQTEVNNMKSDLTVQGGEMAKLKEENQSNMLGNRFGIMKFIGKQSVFMDFFSCT